MLKEHPAYRTEWEKLRAINQEVQTALEFFTKQLESLKINTSQILQQFQHNPDEGSPEYIELMTSTEMIKFYDEKLRGLRRTQDKPYFARIDFLADDKTKTEICYIGKTGLTRESDNQVIIVDWRAPIATLYYEGRLGESSYLVPLKVLSENRLITGELLLKRQFTIENSTLYGIFDIDITTNDPLLQQALGANADNRLKDIAATIQLEQNQIIRADINAPLIVQGVAGSGKTTIALHRIAYLIYTYEDRFDPDTFMIIAPNRLFLNYISEVLPELGAEYVKQTTFIDFMLDHLRGKFTIRNPNEKLIKLVNQKDSQQKRSLIQESASFKGSLLFKKILDKYLKDIEENFLPKNDLEALGHTLISASSIKSIFLAEYKYYPIYKRAIKLKTRLKHIVKKKIKELIAKEEAKADRVIEIFSLKSAVTDEDRQHVLQVAEERDRKIKALTKASNKLVDEYLTQLPNLKLFDYYKDLLTDPEILHIYSGGELSDELIAYLPQQWKSNIIKSQIEIEDLAPLVYLKLYLYGFPKRLRLSHVVIDEAQDFSPLQFFVLKKLTNTESFTIMGDLSQGIHSYRSINDWQQIDTEIFSKTPINYKTLVQSYRTTMEIMHLANEVIKNFLPRDNQNLLAKPIIRHGELPRILRENSPKKLIDFISDEIQILQKREVKSIAIICKNIEECQKVYQSMPKKLRLQTKLITEDITEYCSGLMIIPSYIAKGLEFDCVFIVALKASYEQTELEIKLLYIAMTRALHHLYICSLEEISPMLNAINPQLYHPLNLKK